MLKIFTVLATTVWLASCAVHTPGGSVIVDPVVHSHSSSGGGFCPPGQAKKGRC